jgi:hypothetical protein
MERMWQIATAKSRHAAHRRGQRPDFHELSTVGTGTGLALPAWRPMQVAQPGNIVGERGLALGHFSITEEPAMSDPRYTDPRYSDTDSRRRPDLDPPRRLDLEPQDNSSTMWTGVAVIVAIIVILGLVIGYNRTEQASNQPSNPPTTTGAAPSTPRPAPPANTGGNASQPTPAPTPTPAQPPR